MAVLRADLGSEFAEPSDEQVEDLLHLQSLLERHRAFLAGADRRVYNPGFGHASDLVGGADADMLLGTTLLDIKTSVDPTYNWQEVAQLVGYCVLAAMDGAHWPVRQLGFYRARHSRFELVDVGLILRAHDLISLAHGLLEAFGSEGRARHHRCGLLANAQANLRMAGTEA
jgi:hypothetical protein